MLRRQLLLAGFAFPLHSLAQTCGVVTEAQTEGPFFKPRSPKRISLREGATTAPGLLVAGRVLTADCKPVANALLDFWHADDHGEYDNAGYRYRGLVRTDAQGRYRLETNLPPPYSGRPRHIHVKLQPPGGRVLTTQLYFPGESRGADRALVVKLERQSSSLDAFYDFVLI